MPLRWTRGLKQPTLAHSSAFYRQLQLSCRVNLCLLAICRCCCHMGRQVEHQVPQRVSRVYESLGMPWMTIYEITFSGILSVVLGTAQQGQDSLLESGGGTLWLQSVLLIVLLVTRSLRKSCEECCIILEIEFWWNNGTLAFKDWRQAEPSGAENVQPWRRRLLAHRQLSWAIVVSILCSRCDPAEIPFGPFWERHEWRRL